MNHTSIGGHDYISTHQASAIPYLVIATSATIIGVSGNIMVLLSLLLYGPLRKRDNLFLLNLNLADLVVTAFGDPFGIIGKFFYQLQSVR